MRRSYGLLVLGALVILGAGACTGAASAPPTTAPTAAPAQGPGSGDALGPDAVPGENAAPVLPGEQLIVYTGRLDLDVADLNAAVQQAEQLVAGLGGHVASSEAHADEGSQSASVTYRVPAPRWSEALTGLRALGTRVNESTESDDVTAQVVDLDARIVNLQATEAALQAIMDQATTITDVLKVQDELSTVRSEIESLTAQRDILAGRAALSTLTVGFNVPVAATSLASEGWNLGNQIDDAVASLVRIGQGAASLAIWLVIVVLPVLLPVVGVILLAAWVRRRWLATHPQSPAV